MISWQIVLAAALVGGLGLALFVVVVRMSRHKKAGVGELDLLGAQAVVEATLEPEGSVLVRGELWRARLLGAGGKVERGQRVRVVGASRHLLEVEPIT